jgi:hypothetical protein
MLKVGKKRMLLGEVVNGARAHGDSTGNGERACHNQH